MGTEGTIEEKKIDQGEAEQIHVILHRMQGPYIKEEDIVFPTGYLPKEYEQKGTGYSIYSSIKTEIDMGFINVKYAKILLFILFLVLVRVCSEKILRKMNNYGSAFIDESG